jgi:hypothetical protein
LGIARHDEVNDADAHTTPPAQQPKEAAATVNDDEDQDDEMGSEKEYEEREGKGPSQPAAPPGGSASDRYDQPPSTGHTGHDGQPRFDVPRPYASGGGLGLRSATEPPSPLDVWSRWLPACHRPPRTPHDGTWPPSRVVQRVGCSTLDGGQNPS